MDWRVVNSYFFVSRKDDRSNDDIYHLLHEFYEIEELEQNMSEIINNFRQLRFSLTCQTRLNKFFAIINCSESGLILGKNILLPSTLSIKMPNQFLFKMSACRILLKVILKIELRINFYYDFNILI